MTDAAAPQDRVQRLASLWRSLLARPPHPVGCTCMGHLLIPALSAKDMEADILDYMRSRYAGEGLAPLVALLDAREAAREAIDIPALPFRQWLLRLPGAGLDPAALDRFTADLLATLESFEANSRAAGGGLFCT